jgi:hypothetical protein
VVDAGTIVGIAVTVFVLGIIGFVVYRRLMQVRNYGKKIYPGRKTTPEGEPLEDPRSYSPDGGLPRRITRIAIPAIVAIIVVSVVLASSIKIVEAGNRGVLLRFGAVDTSQSLDEGLHFVTPFRDNIIQVETRTQKTVESAASASKDLQDVRTEVALNYHVRRTRRSCTSSWALSIRPGS